MALAFLRFIEIDDQDVVFGIDVGSSGFFRFSIGAGRTSRDGVPLLRDVSYQSEIRRAPISNPFSSMKTLRIPLAHMSRQNRFVQLTSFVEADGRGPTWSRVLEVYPVHDTNQRRLSHMSSVMNHQNVSTSPAEPEFETCRSVSTEFTQSQLSSAMFWDQLLNIAGLLAPAASQLLGQAINQNSSANINPNTIQQIIQALIDVGTQVQAPQTPTAQTPADEPSTERNTSQGEIAQAQSLSRRYGAAQLPQRFTGVPHAAIKYRRAQSMPRAMDGGLISGPMLAGLISTLGPSVISALGPVLESAPQLLETYMDSPIRLLNAINQAQQERQRMTNERIQNMLTQGNQALLLHFLNNGNSGGQAAAALPSTVGAGNGTAVAQSLRRPYQRRYAQVSRPRALTRIEKNDELAISFVWPEPISIDNKPKAVFSTAGDIALSIRVDVNQSGAESTQPQRLAKVIVKLEIIDLVDNRRLGEEIIRHKNLGVGEILNIPLSQRTKDSLPLHADLIARVRLKWMDENGRDHGVQKNAVQALYLVNNYFFGQAGASLNTPMALDDPARYRAFWHRIWEGGSRQHKRWYLQMMSRYYYRMAEGETSNARGETKIKLNEDKSSANGTRITWDGMLKSGMDLAVSELNKLLPVMKESESWTQEQVDALQCPEFEKLLNQQATANIEMRGRTEERGSLWVFPVVDLMDIELQKVMQVSDNGAVLQIEKETKSFPIPVDAVFVGAELES